jgi:ABC-type antimicrobial peptide transport system permease subunit
VGEIMVFDVQKMSWQSRRDATYLLDFFGILGFLTALGLGIVMHLNALQTMFAASSYLAVCFFSSALLCTIWGIPKSFE